MAEEQLQLFTSIRYDPLLASVHQSEFKHAGWNFEHKSPLYMLNYHRDRLLRAATHWGWPEAVAIVTGDAGLKRLQDVIASAISGKADGPLKARVVLTKSGHLHCDASIVPAAPLATLFPARLPPPGAEGAHEEDMIPKKEPIVSVVLDSTGSAPSEYTHHKTTNRAVYDAARRRADIRGLEKEVLLTTGANNSLVMDGSVTTVYFWRDGAWVTPPVPRQYDAGVGSGGLDGTSRRWAVERCFISLAYILATSTEGKRLTDHRGTALERDVQVVSIVDGEECWLSNGVRGFQCGRIQLSST